MMSHRPSSHASRWGRQDDAVVHVASLAERWRSGWPWPSRCPALRPHAGERRRGWRSRAMTPSPTSRPASRCRARRTSATNGTVRAGSSPTPPTASCFRATRRPMRRSMAATACLGMTTGNRGRDQSRGLGDCRRQALPHLRPGKPGRVAAEPGRQHRPGRPHVGGAAALGGPRHCLRAHPRAGLPRAPTPRSSRRLPPRSRHRLGRRPRRR